MQITFENFYDHHDHVVTFLNKFSQEFPENQKLTLVEKFKLYTEKYPDYDCWASAIHHAYDPQDKMNDVFIALRQTFVSMRGKIVRYTNKGKENISEANSFCNDNTGYFVFGVGKKYFKVHRVLASTFLKRPNELKNIPYHKLQVNHIDGNKGNPDLSNLEWVSSAGNVNHALKNGLRPMRIYTLLLNKQVGEFPIGSKFHFTNAGLIEHGFDPTHIVKVENAYSVKWIISDYLSDILLGFPAGITKEMIVPEPNSFIIILPSGERRIFRKDADEIGIPFRNIRPNIKKGHKTLGYYWREYTDADATLPVGFPEGFTFSKPSKYRYFRMDVDGNKVYYENRNDVEKDGFNKFVVTNAIRNGWKYGGFYWGKEIKSP